MAETTTKPEQVLRRFGPKAADHPTVTEPCAACGQLFMAGDYTTLVALGPGADERQQALAREGRAYATQAAEVHWSCATGEKS